MRPFLTLLLALALAPLAWAQESPEDKLDFARKLRAKPGFAGVAKEYFQRLEQEKNPGLLAVLGLEQARTQLAIARELPFHQRSAPLEAAKAKFEDYIKTNQGKPDAARAQVELARVLMVEGQTKLSLALREDGEAAQHDSARPAEALFLRAGAELESAIKLLKENKFDEEANQATFERGFAFIEQGRTNINIDVTAVNKARSALIVKAQNVFKSLEADKTSPAGMLANAWLIKTSIELQDQSKVKEYQEAVKAATGPGSGAARRLAAYFYLQNLNDDPDISNKTDRNALRKTLVQKWLDDFPTARKTPEGEAVVFMMGQILLGEARAKKKDGPDPKLLEQAKKYFKELADGDSDFAQKADGIYKSLEFVRITTGATELKGFDDYFLKANFDLNLIRKTAGKLESAAPAEKEKLKKEYQENMSNLVRTLNLAVSASNDSTPVAKVADAKLMLTSAYLVSGDHYRAAVAGDSLARHKPPLKSSASAAAYAMQAYLALYNSVPDKSAPKALALKKRIDNLVDFVLSDALQKDWKDEPVSGFSRYEKATQYQNVAARILSETLKEEKGPVVNPTVLAVAEYAKALDQLDKISPSYAAYHYIRSQMVFLNLKVKDLAGQDEKNLIKESRFDDAKVMAEIKTKYHQKTVQAIQGLPPLPASPDQGTALIYFRAKLKYPEFLYAQGLDEVNAGLAKTDGDAHFAAAKIHYDNMAKSVKETADIFEKVRNKLAPANQEGMELSLKTLGRYALYGKADLEYRVGGEAGLDNVLEQTLPIHAALIKNAPPKGPIVLKDVHLVGDILSLALRASVQKGKLTGARKIYETINRIQGEDAVSGFNAENLARSLVFELQRQLKVYQQKDTELFEKSKQNFAEFIDDMAKQMTEAGLKDENRLFLASFYSSIEQHNKAAELFKQITPPTFLNQEKLSPDEEKKVKAYWGMQLEYSKTLRLSKETKALEEAKKLLEAMIDNKKAHFQFLAEFELNLVHQDMEYYALSIKSWSGLMPSLNRNLGKIETELKLIDKDLKAMEGKVDEASAQKQVSLNRRRGELEKNQDFVKQKYFDAYYNHTYSWYKASQTKQAKERKKEELYLSYAVKDIVSLEFSPSSEGWKIAGPRFEELIRTEQPLREEYEKQKELRKAKDEKTN